MNSTPDTLDGKAVLVALHMVGMVDLVALPLWIGALVQSHGYSPAQAGVTVTLFLLGIVAASGLFAPRFNRVPRRGMAAAGFAVSALAFAMAARQPAGDGFALLAALHLLAGLGTGTALSMTHGAIGRSANPHRLFAVASVGLGVFAVLFLATMPRLTQQGGAALLFNVVAAMMALAAALAALAFPTVPDAPAASAGGADASRRRIPRAAWFTIAVVVCLTLNQAMVFAFVERMGADRGYGQQLPFVFIALGLVNLLPGVLAALLQNHWSPIAVGIGGPVGQAVLALTMATATSFAPYAVAVALYVSMVIFTHSFLFGLLSRLDPSGRAVAATPAMMMLGSCIGPALGGAIVQGMGYGGLGYAACAVSCLAVIGMLQVRHRLRADTAPVAGRERAAAA